MIIKLDSQLSKCDGENKEKHKKSIFVGSMGLHIFAMATLFLVYKGYYHLGSWMWRKLLKYRTIAKSIHKVDVKSDNEGSFWFDDWCHLGTLMEVSRARGTIDMGISSNTTIASVLDTHRRRRHRVDNLNNIEDAIDAMRLQRCLTEADVHLWRFKTGKYAKKFSSKHLASNSGRERKSRLV